MHLSLISFYLYTRNMLRCNLRSQLSALRNRYLLKPLLDYPLHMSVFSPHDFCFCCKLDGIPYRSLVVSNNSQTSPFNNKVSDRNNNNQYQVCSRENRRKKKKCAEIVPSRRYDEGPKFLSGRIFLCSDNDGFWWCVCTDEKCFYLWWQWCRYRGGIYKQTSMCSLHSIEFLYNAPPTRTCMYVRYIYIYIYTHLDQKLLWAQVSACPLAQLLYSISNYIPMYGGELLHIIE